MGPFGLMHSAVDGLRRVPGLAQVYRHALNRQFANNTNENLFRGVFDSVDSALASAPPTRPLTYDNEGSANLYLKRLRIDDYDHPSMFWLSRALDQGMRSVVDIGGSIGIKYYAFSEFVDFPADLKWRVIDMPVVAARGREFAASRGNPPGLEFSDQMADADGTDVLFASGVLQYLPQTLAEIVRGLKQRPRRIVINTTPIHAQRSFFTLNSIGTAYCAYRVQAHRQFVESILGLGYQLRDEWRNIGKQMPLPLEPGYGLDRYSGFCFDAAL